MIEKDFGKKKRIGFAIIGRSIKVKKLRYKKSIICVHGVDKNRLEPCPICKASNAYAKKDVESLGRRFDNRKPANFVLAFDIKNRFNKWQKIYKIHSFDYYLEEL